MYKSYFKRLCGVKAVFSNRFGGVSQRPYNSLNLGLDTGDKTSLVRENRKLFLNKLRHSEETVAFADQYHSNNISIVTKPGISFKTDGLITQQKNLPLVIQVADCACVFLYEPTQKVIGLVHAGWRGAHKKIVSRAIQIIVEKFHGEPAKIHVQISACISEKSFFVGKDVYSLFDASYFLKHSREKWLFNLKNYLYDECKENGIFLIEVDKVCTYKSRSYFSYRRDGEQSGRMMGFLMRR